METIQTGRTHRQTDRPVAEQSERASAAQPTDGTVPVRGSGPPDEQKKERSDRSWSNQNAASRSVSGCPEKKGAEPSARFLCATAHAARTAAEQQQRSKPPPWARHDGRSRCNAVAVGGCAVVEVLQRWARRSTLIQELFNDFRPARRQARCRHVIA
ncbi:hypothetical protein BC567DRAFT_273844 [Phyllosticta citribraziliensis]